MSHGIIEVLDVVQWKIADCLSLRKCKNEFIDSPRFSAVGCTWHLRAYPNGDRDGEFLAVYLWLDGTPPETVTYSIGLKLADGEVEDIGTLRNKEFKSCGGMAWGWSSFFNLNDLKERKSELVPSGTLTITCRIEPKTADSEEIAPNPQEVNTPPTTFLELEDLSSDFKNMLSNEKTCDFTINVQGKEFRSHRFALAARSPVFRAMLEHDTAEAKSGVLNIPDCHLESFQEFLNFLYTGKIEDVSFETAYHLYSTADKYDVQRLKSLCTDYLRENMIADNVCKVITLSDQVCDHELQASAQGFFNKNSLQIFLTSEWEAMMKDDYRLASKVLKQMAAEGLKSS